MPAVRRLPAAILTALALAVAPPLHAAGPPAVALKRVPDRGIQPQAVVDAAGTLHLIYFKGPPAAPWPPTATATSTSPGTPRPRAPRERRTGRSGWPAPTTRARPLPASGRRPRCRPGRAAAAACGPSPTPAAPCACCTARPW